MVSKVKNVIKWSRPVWSGPGHLQLWEVTTDDVLYIISCYLPELEMGWGAYGNSQAYDLMTQAGGALPVGCTWRVPSAPLHRSSGDVNHNANKVAYLWASP